MLDNKPILPLGHPKYGGFSTNDMPFVPTIFPPPIVHGKGEF